MTNRQELRAKEATAADGAKGSGFNPLPFLGNAHVQTILANVLSGMPLLPKARKRLVPLGDGDQLVVHDSRPAQWIQGDPVAVVVHGLGGNHDSAYVQRTAARLSVKGFRVLRVDLRGCGDGLPLARKPYHAGSSRDIRLVVEHAARWCPASPVSLVGFSLGGNIVLKAAGEAATDHLPNLYAVAALAPPIHVARCVAMISQPDNRIYELNFIRELTALARRRARLFPDTPRVRFPGKLKLREFDDLYTAPRNGFRDATEYYERAAALPFVPRIAVPAYVLTARDDPFIAVEPFETLERPVNVQVEIVEKGGHLGFLGWDGQGGIRWAERRLADWVIAVQDRDGHGPGS